MFTLLNRAAGYESKELEEASDPLCGGILMGLDCACGVLWGAALAAGVRASKRITDKNIARLAALEAAKAAVAAYSKTGCQPNCRDVTKLSKWNMMRFLLKGNLRVCQQQLIRFGPVFDRVIDETIGSVGEAQSSGTSNNCASEAFHRTAEAIGFDEEEGQTITAGLAGGLGLSGNGCGALAGAIFALALKHFKDRQKAKHSMIRSNLQGLGIGDGWMNPAREVQRSFVGKYGTKTCASIAGRSFSSVADLNAHLSCGACDAVVETLTEAAGNTIDH